MAQTERFSRRLAKPAAERRQEIIDKAAEVLLKKGLNYATTREVTMRIGVGAGLLNHYFSWRELRALAFECAVKRDLADAFAAKGTALERLGAFVDMAFLEEDDAAWRLWSEGWDEAGQDRLIGDVCARQFEAWRHAL